MATTYFYQYPAGSYDAFNRYSQNYANVDDPEPITAHDGITSYDYVYGQAGVTTASGMTYSLTAPPTGVTVNKVRVYGAFFTSNAGADAFATAPEVVACVRPAGSGTYYTAAATKVGGTGSVTGTARLTGMAFYNRNTASWGGDDPITAYWEWSTNPVTGVAWTLSDLQNLKIGWFCDGSKGSSYTGTNVPDSSNSSYVACSALFLWAEAATVAASIESERAKGSQFLRLFRKPVKKVTVTVPAEYADLDIGDTIAFDHPRWPHPSGEAGWGKKDWQRREGIILSSVINPSTREVTLTALDAREFRCGLWSPLVTDIGFSEDGNGIPILHQGSGFTFPSSSSFRASTHYVKKQDDDATYAAGGAGKGLWTPAGMWASFAKVTNQMTYSCFSGGSGTTFTNWGWASSGGGARAEDTSNYLIDASGFRRGIKLTTPTSGTSYVYQTSASIGGAGQYGRVRIHVNQLAAASAGDGKVYYQLYRTSDAQYWDNANGVWGGALSNIVTDGTTLGLQRYVSEAVDLSTASTYSLYVGFLGAATSAQATLNEVSFFTAADKESACGMAAENEPILPSTSAAKAMERDLAYIDCTTGDEMREDRGTLFLTVTPTFSHGDMADGDQKIIWTYRRHMGLEWMRCRYYRSSSTAATVYFERYVAEATASLGTTYSCSVALSGTGDSELAQRGQAISLACRWSSASDELDLGQRQMDLFVIPRPTYSVEKATPAVYADFSGYGITASDIVTMSSQYSNSLTRSSAAAAWDQGFATVTSNQRITSSGGGVSFAPPRSTTWTASRFFIGLDQSNPNASYTGIDYALYFDNDGSTNIRWAVYENGAGKTTGGANSWKCGDVYGGYLGRVQYEAAAGAIRYYVGSTLVYTSLTAPTLPLYVDASFLDVSTPVYGVALYGTGIAGEFGDPTTWQPPRLEFPCEDSMTPSENRSEVGGFSYQHLEVVPYVLTDEEVKRRMRS